MFYRLRNGWLFVALCAGLAPDACAAPRALAELKGMDQMTVEEQLGNPDERRGAGEGRESWLYGSSVILFRDGKVTAWSDAGDLLGRKNIAKVKKGSGREGSGGEESAPTSSLIWRNAWTPWQDIDAAQVIDEVQQRANAGAAKSATP